MKIIIIQYNAGNIESVLNALKRLDTDAEVTGDKEKIMAADKVIFPGVGEASSTMKYLREKKLDQVIFSLRQPVLGICLGLQLMCAHSEEGDTPCLGIFDEKVKRFTPEPGQEYSTKVPHMGWNALHHVKSDLFDNSLENQYVYFVHSYFAGIGDHTIATCHYIAPFSAALQKDNFFATQFHPEKSGEIGELVLKKFINL